ncbi:MAG TPA: histidine ammonia-lyase [bacterium]|nr:histidine ammonia-lyase [bacterium]HQG45022.1 histidine ammonia-lyase [bacterium]HQI47295.1 histidine ammonia-lyase [bacterium]HQJ63782.1 histidine ammonia-lyase [bacterium]
MQPILLDGNSLTLSDLFAVAAGRPVAIAPAAMTQMAASRACIEAIIRDGRVVYGVNTGFGKLASIHIADDALDTLQRNLVLSHACGVGVPIPAPLVRALIALKINTLCKGYSGTRPEVAVFLQEMLNRGLLPIIPSKGSVGASGDLAPLAHMTLVMIGLGEALFQGERLPGAVALQRAGLEPVTLKAKEGLAVLNGTQVLTAYAAFALQRALQLARLADIAAAISIESLLNSRVAFDPRIQKARGHQAQIRVAENLIRLLAMSEIVESHSDCSKVQDAYSSRCTPQVHGAVRQALAYAEGVISTELNASTDNPLIFAAEQEVLSGGNFHGQPVSLACDTLAIAVAQLANISERRLENLMDPVQSGLPPFLAAESGTNSGFMIAQVTAAALVSENKVLTHPASVDSIPTSANQEDFVSMGAWSSRKALEVVENSETVLGIELLAGCQAMDFRQGLEPGQGTGIAWRYIRSRIPSMPRDRLLHDDIGTITAMVQENSIVRMVEEVIGAL